MRRQTARQSVMGSVCNWNDKYLLTVTHARLVISRKKVIKLTMSILLRSDYGDGGRVHSLQFAYTTAHDVMISYSNVEILC